MGKMDDKLDKVLNKLDEKCSREEVVQIVDEKISESIDKNIEKKIEEKFNEFVKEKKNMEDRRRNLMFFHVPECQSPEIDVRIEADKKSVENLLIKIREDFDSPLSIVRPRRMGEQAENVVRPLRVTFESEQVVSGILKEAKNIKELQDLHPDDEYLKEIVIAPDLTPMQRKKRNELVETLNKRKAKGEKDLKIFRGKIVKKPKPGNSAGSPPGGQ